MGVTLGFVGVTFSSGSAALMGVCHLHRWKRILCIDDVYGGTRRFLLRVLAADPSIQIDFIRMDSQEMLKDLQGMLVKQIDERDRKETLVWVESPSNPTLKMVDIGALAGILKPLGMLLVVDSTFATPALQQPLALGACLVVHSATKFLGGHSDVVLGAVIGLKREGSPLETRLRFLQNTLGAVPSPFDCYLVMRGLKTLALRMRQHCSNAAMIVAFLGKHPGISRVYYPALANPELVSRQMSGCGGAMVSFEIHSGWPVSASEFCQKCRVFTLAESLGCVESLCEVPALMTHAAVEEEARAALGINDRLVRLSVGIEDPDDLINDLGQALTCKTDSIK